MSSLVQKYQDFIASLGSERETLVAVSKTKPNEDILALYDLGQRKFGENKVQELVRKASELPGDIQWHMVGHLQTNKVKLIVPFVSLIHSVDSVKLLLAIEKEAMKQSKQIRCLLQVHVAKEESKYGFSPDEIIGLTEGNVIPSLTHVQVVGLMGMATFSNDLELVRSEFSLVHSLFERVKTKPGIDASLFRELSMGMSNDYSLALEEGATLIRIGSLIFGERYYH